MKRTFEWSFESGKDIDLDVCKAAAVQIRQSKIKPSRVLITYAQLMRMRYLDKRNRFIQRLKYAAHARRYTADQ